MRFFHFDMLSKDYFALWGPSPGFRSDPTQNAPPGEDPTEKGAYNAFFPFDMLSKDYFAPRGPSPGFRSDPTQTGPPIRQVRPLV